MREVGGGDDNEGGAEDGRSRGVQRDPEGEQAAGEQDGGRQLDCRIDQADPRPAAPAPPTEDQVAERAVRCRTRRSASRTSRTRSAGTRSSGARAGAPRPRSGSSRRPDRAGLRTARARQPSSTSEERRGARSAAGRGRASASSWPHALPGPPGSRQWCRCTGRCCSGIPSCAYVLFRDRVSVTVGAPVSRTTVPAAGCCSTTVFTAYPFTGPVTCQANPPSWRIPLAKT